MKKIALSMAVAAFLSGCGGDADEANPVSGGPLPGEGAEGIPADVNTGNQDIPEVLSDNLNAVDFNASSETLVISIGGLDAGSDTSVYTRDTSLDVPGFAAFKKQDDPLDRFFIALAKQSPDGTSQAFAITDGGQFNRFFGGTRFENIGTYTQPTTGLVSYAGEYGATTNLGELDTTQLLAVPAGLSERLLPRQPARIRGKVFFNVDFAEDQINGEIYDRELIRFDNTVVQSGTNMPNVSLIVTEIADDGTFSGEAEDSFTEDNFGTYGGTFGGSEASSLSGTVKLDRFSDVYDQEEEYGAFALGRCGTPGDDALCDDLE